MKKMPYPSTVTSSAMRKPGKDIMMLSVQTRASDRNRLRRLVAGARGVSTAFFLSTYGQHIVLFYMLDGKTQHCEHFLVSKYQDKIKINVL